MATNDGGHEPRSYGDMVMGEYLKGLAEIAKEHPSKIEQLEALEKAATAGPWITGGCSGRMIKPVAFYGGDGFLADTDLPEHAELIVAARNALPALLAVAKAAKALRATDSKGDWCPMTEEAMEDRERFTAELDAALSRLEAQ